MPEIKTFKLLSAQELAQKVTDLGKEDFTMTISPQAMKIISNYPNFPWDKFKLWFKKNYCVVNGMHLHHYLSTQIDKDL